MASVTSPQPTITSRKKADNTLAQPPIAEPDIFTGPTLEELNQSLSKLGSARQSLVDETEGGVGDRDFANALSKVQSALGAVQDYSHNLEQRLAKTKLEPEQTSSSLGTAAATTNTENTAEAESEAGDKTEFCFNGKSVVQSLMDFGATMLSDPQIFLGHYQRFAVELLQIVQGKSTLAPERRDHRFRDGVWRDNVFYRAVLQTYLAWSQQLEQLIDDLPFEDEDDRRRSHFLAAQFTAACSPSNSVFNPAVVKRSFQTGGLSLVAGTQNFLKDIATNHGMPRQINPNAYRVGEDLAVTEGAVVLRTDVLELIQYRSTTAKVYRRPVVFVPPQINKYYIFDLSPKNSMVQHLLQNGHQVFMVSWRNPRAANSEWSLTTYIKHVQQALKACAAIGDCPEVNLVSGCAGGMTATVLQSYCQGLPGNSPSTPRIHSHSLLVTALSAKQHPILNLFLDKNMVSMILSRSAKKGVMDGRELSHVFAWLRPVDLVWNFWVNNVLLGKEPPTMDVLYWDNDSTRLPAALHRDFVDLVVNDRFRNPGTITIDGRPMDLSAINTDFYFVGGEDDYLMPWQNCYRNIDLFPNANCRFVLSTGGHIQSILRPPHIAHTYYYANEQQPQDPERWWQNAEKFEGSWWDDWAQWLGNRGGDSCVAPTELGSRDYPSLCPSPGTYVLEK